MSVTIDKDEVEKFSRIADEWWDENGKFKPLHKLNPARIGYIKESILTHFNKESLEGLKLLDVGCGGGLVAEPMCRLGADVTAIDASEENIKTASVHAEQGGLDINYIHTTSDELAKKKGKFDVILALEIIEHVADVETFVESLSGLLKKDGLLILSTLNRTAKSYTVAIVGAEYVMRWLPRGTHDWKKFIKPSEMAEMLEKQGLNVNQLKGLDYKLLSDSFEINDDVSVNYFAKCSKV